MKRSPLAVLFLVVLVDLLGFGIVLPLLPRYAADFEAGGWAIGALQGSFSLMQLIFMPLWGRLSDRVGRRPVLLVGLAGSVVSYVMFGLADSFALLMASRIAAGVFGATIGTAQAYISDVTTDEQRGKAMALIGAAFGVGFAVGPTLGGLTHDWIGVWAPGITAAALSLVAFVLAWFLLPEPERHRESIHGKVIGTRALRHALTTPTIPLILFLQFVATFAFANFEGTLAILTKVKWDYDIAANGLLFSYVGLCLLVIQGGLVRRLIPKYGELNFTFWGCCILVLGLLGVAYAGGTLQALLLLPVAILGFSMITPSLASLLSRRTPKTMQGEVLGIGQSVLALARMVGPAVGMPLMGIAHPEGSAMIATHPEWPYYVGAATMVVAAVAALVLRRAPVPGVPDVAASGTAE